MKYQRCDNCKDWHWTNRDCDPIYLVYYEEDLGDEPFKVRASDHEDAALKFAEQYNTQSDYVLMDDTIDVKVEKDGVIKFFTVGAETTINYISQEKTATT